MTKTIKPAILFILFNIYISATYCFSSSNGDKHSQNHNTNHNNKFSNGNKYINIHHKYNLHHDNSKDNGHGITTTHVNVNHHTNSHHTSGGNHESNSVLSIAGHGDGGVIVGPKLKRRKSRKSPNYQVLKTLFGNIKSRLVTLNSTEDSELNNSLKKLEKLLPYCDFSLEDFEAADNDHEVDVTDELAGMLGIDKEIFQKVNVETDTGDIGSSNVNQDNGNVVLRSNIIHIAESSTSSSSNNNNNNNNGNGNKKRKTSTNFKNSANNPKNSANKANANKLNNKNKLIAKEADKQEIQRLKRLVIKLKEHQAAEVNKLKQVKEGVENLVSSLSEKQNNLLIAKHESSDLGRELERAREQASAAELLEKEINEIQEHAKINYETGLIELEQETGVISQLSLEEVAAKVQQGHRYHGHDDKTDDILSNLADPAVLHADLRLLLDIVLLLGSATIGGMMAAVCYMPPIIGYIFGGIIVGPSGLDLIHTVVEVDTLAQFGSVFFLFAHGLEYSLSEQRQFQTVAVGGCLLTTALCAICIQGYTLATGIVQTPLEGALLGLSSSLSSLSLVLDYLHTQRLLHTVHGKVMVGFLTFQGLMMGLIFSIPPAISGGVVSMGGITYALSKSSFGIAVVAFFGFFFSRYMMPTLLEFLTKNRANYDELYLLGVVSLAMVMALLTEFLGLSLDLGAFFAGLMLAGTPYMKRTATAIQPLAQVFAAMLFASIGMIINPNFFWANLGVIFIVVIQIVVIKVIIVTIVLRIFNYSWNVSVVSGIGLAHVGEFSLLFSSKLQAHLLLSRRAYLIFLAATVTTIVLAPLVLRAMHIVIPKIMHLLGIPYTRVLDEDYHPLKSLSRGYRPHRLS